MDRPPGPISDAALPGGNGRTAAPHPRPARAGGEEPCGEDDLGLFRGLALAAAFSAAFWPGVLLLARALW